MPKPWARGRLRVARAFLLASGLWLTALPARAGGNDLALMNLCDVSGGSCPWIVQDGNATTVDLARDPNATTKFRSLMSELGVVVAPRLQTPADTLGFAGFQFSAEVGTTQISRDQSFWNGVQGVEPGNPNAHRPNRWLTTVGAFVRKGMWFPIPAVEWGVGGVNVLQSSMWSLQGYLKLALLEGFHRWAVPSIAVRGSAARLVGTDQISMTVLGFDVVISKAFSLAGTARFQPFAGWNVVFVDAQSAVIDATPKCDAYELRQANANDPTAATRLSGCPAAQIGTWGDLGANFSFPDQDMITRHRVYGGAKLKLSVLFLVAQFAYAPAGRTRDEKAAGLAALDDSQAQQSLTLSAGFDF